MKQKSSLDSTVQYAGHCRAHSKSLISSGVKNTELQKEWQIHKNKTDSEGKACWPLLLCEHLLIPCAVNSSKNR